MLEKEKEGCGRVDGTGEAAGLPTAHCMIVFGFSGMGMGACGMWCRGGRSWSQEAAEVSYHSALREQRDADREGRHTHVGLKPLYSVYVHVLYSV